MSLGVPSADNRNGVTSVASLFSTLGKSPAGNGAAGVSGRVNSDSQYRGLDWASTLRQSTSQLHEQRSRQPVTAGEKAAARVSDQAADRKSDRSATADKDRPTSRADNRTGAVNDRSVRDVRRDDAQDTPAVRDDIDASLSEGSSALAPEEIGMDEQPHLDDASIDIVEDDDAGDDATEPTTDVLALALAGELAAAAGAVSGSAQQTPEADAQVQAAQNQNKQQGAVQASQLQQPAAADGSTVQQAGQAQAEGKGEGKAALPAQAANAAAAQAQQNSGSAGASAEQQAATQQQNQQGQSQGQSGQSGQPGQSGQSGQQHAAAHTPAASLPAAGATQQAAIEIPTSTTGSNAQAAAGSSAASHVGTAATAASTLPAGADALLQAQGQDDTDPNVARIAQGLRAGVNLKGGAVTIRLNPHELGHVRIEMEIKNGNISAQLQTEQASVRDLLNHQLGKLRETLQARGLHVERLEVSAPAPADDSSAGRNAQESPDQGRSRGQFFQQRGGSDGQNGSASHNANNISERKSFGDMLVDMVG